MHVRQAVDCYRLADTRFYWDLTPHIFRYNHRNSGTGGGLASGVHTVNESECNARQ